MLSAKIVDNKYRNYLLHQVFRVLYADKHLSLSVAKEFSRKKQTNSLTVRINAFVLKMGKLRLFFFGLWITILSAQLSRNSDFILSDTPIHRLHPMFHSTMNQKSTWISKSYKMAVTF